MDFDNNFHYLQTNSKNNSIDFFSLTKIGSMVLTSLNQGIKAFNQNKTQQAKRFFDLTIRYDPSNALAYWNLARLHIYLNGQKEEVLHNYQLAMANFRNKRLKKQIQEEIQRYSKNPKSFSKIEPIQYRM